jgi:hypothetical protein
MKSTQQTRHDPPHFLLNGLHAGIAEAEFRGAVRAEPMGEQPGVPRIDGYLRRRSAVRLFWCISPVLIRVAYCASPRFDILKESACLAEDQYF